MRLDSTVKSDDQTDASPIIPSTPVRHHTVPPPAIATPATRRIQTIRNIHHRKPSRDRPESRRAHHRGRRQMRHPRRSTRSVRRDCASIHPSIHPSDRRVSIRDARRWFTRRWFTRKEKGAFYVPVSVVVVDVLVCAASILIYPPAGVGRRL